MSTSLYFTIRENQKSHFVCDTFFFGKQEVYDYKRVVDKIFDYYEDALKFINDNHLSLKNVHIRKSYDLGGGITNIDYIKKMSTLY